MKVAVIGAGFSGLSTACYLAKAGYDVSVYEKNATIGGRCRQFTESGFTFDMGPSWYWMPEVFENFFNDFNHSVADFYKLKRLDPSYTVYFSEEKTEISADLEKLKNWFETIEPGSGKKLDAFLDDAAKKYDAGMNRFVHKPSISITEFIDGEIISGLFKLDLLRSFSKHVRNYFKHPYLIQLLEFPVLFLGATPSEIPALYSLMNYADIIGGTWYPDKGMYEIVKAMAEVCKELGVKIHTSSPVEKFHLSSNNSSVGGIEVNGQLLEFDIIIGSSDYHHTEQLLPKEYRNYTESYWNKRKMAPSCVLFYVGIDKKIDSLNHHTLFFDTEFKVHANEIYKTPKWPDNPLFYVCAPSVSDESVAPNGCENLFFLVPIAPGLEDTEEARENAFNKIVNRFENHTNSTIREHIIYKKSYCVKDFVNDYNAYQGNAYGLANTLNQTAFLKPKLINKKLNNLFYTGQLTVPGPGVPPSIISGKVAANLIGKKFPLKSSILNH